MTEEKQADELEGESAEAPAEKSTDTESEDAADAGDESAAEPDIPPATGS